MAFLQKTDVVGPFQQSFECYFRRRAAGRLLDYASDLCSILFVAESKYMNMIISRKEFRCGSSSRSSFADVECTGIHDVNRSVVRPDRDLRFHTIGSVDDYAGFACDVDFLVQQLCRKDITVSNPKGSVFPETQHVRNGTDILINLLDFEEQPEFADSFGEQNDVVIS